MKQRIRVVGILRTGDGVLVLKRSRGRSETPVFWELPTGKIKFGEQPEESIARTIQEYLNLTASSIKLKDVITFLALEGSSRLNNLYIIYDVEVKDLGEKVQPAPRDRYTTYKYLKDFTNISVRLNEASLSVLEIAEGQSNIHKFSHRDTASAATVYVDGASRGNPGPSGVGYYIVDTDGHVLKQGGEFIGFATSRVAEYHAMRIGIEQALALNLKSARFVSDSLMVANQLNGIFTVKNQDILPIYHQIQKLLQNFESVSFTHISRSDNVAADTAANEAIDNILKK